MFRGDGSRGEGAANRGTNTGDGRLKQTLQGEPEHDEDQNHGDGLDAGSLPWELIAAVRARLLAVVFEFQSARRTFAEVTHGQEGSETGGVQGAAGRE